MAQAATSGTDIPLSTLWADGLALLGRDETAQTDVRALIEGITGLSRSQCWVMPERPIAVAIATRLRGALIARAHGQPVAYLLGYRDFWRHRFTVTPATLIPRPETEHLVEWACALLPLHESAVVVDLGTGSGAIAVSVLSERPQNTMLAIDASAEALAVAQENAARLLPASVAARLHWLQGDWAAAVAPASVDMILANPPYLRSDDPHQAQGDLRFEPSNALLAGYDGLSDIRQIITQARRILRGQGRLLFEHGYDQGAAVRALLEAAGFVQIETRLDYSGHERNTLGVLAMRQEV